MQKNTVIVFSFISTFLIAAVSCAKPLEWPKSPLYDFPQPEPSQGQPLDLQAAMEKIAGHYAHFDVVAYEDTSLKTPMRTMVVSYGFTDFRIRDGKLFQKDRFISASQKINQKSVSSSFGDAAAQAIKPEETETELFFKDGRWHLYRPETHTLLGIRGDPHLPLSRDAKDPAIIDADGDGKPGVTVKLNIGNLITGEIYIMRREISSTHMVLNANGSITGNVVDSSEQFVIGASLAILRQPSNATQLKDPGMNPILLVPIDESIDTPEELMAMRDTLFPPEPEFVRP